MSSRLRKAYVAAKFFRVSDLAARARHSVATAACSSGFVASLAMSEPNKSRRQIAIFLLLLLAFSAVFYCLILIAHKLEAGRGLYVSGLMWCAALAFAIFFWSRRRELAATVRQPAQETAVLCMLVNRKAPSPD